MRAAARGLRAAFVFLTRLPLGGHPFGEREWAWAAAYFPLVGFIVGALLSAVHTLLLPLGSLADATLVVALSMLVTGALHEDGLADTFDALGGAFERERVLDILKDSRIGSYGACALIASIVGRVALLDRMGDQASWALALVGCAARVGPVWQMFLLPYVPHAGSKSGAIVRVGPSQAFVATAWVLAASGAAGAVSGASVARLSCLFGAMFVTTAASAWWYARRLGGITGDFLGATEQLGELAGYAVLAWGER